MVECIYLRDAVATLRELGMPTFADVYDRYTILTPRDYQEYIRHIERHCFVNPILSLEVQLPSGALLNGALWPLLGQLYGASIA